MQRTVLFLLALALASCQPGNYQHGHKKNRAMAHLKANLEFLASDALKGREAGTNDIMVAAEFIRSRLEMYGLQPHGDDGGYFSNIPFQRKGISDSSSITLVKGETRGRYTVGRHFFTYQAGDSTYRGNEQPLVFVRFGIDDSTYGYNDYENLDVRNKTVVLILGEPERQDDSTFFKGARPTKWSRSSRIKRKLAREKGVGGVVVLLSPKGMGMWKNMKRFMGSGKLGLAQKQDHEIPEILIDSTLAKNMFGLRDLSYARMYKKLQDPAFDGSALNGKSIQWNLRSQTEKITGHNIVALLPGNDPALADEYILVGAHYDHIGIRNGRIYNGADDNGSGTVVVLETARQMAHLKGNKRPVLFVWFTGEEKGLLGSKYMVEHAPFRDNIRAVVNMDMVGRESADSMFVLASGLSSSAYFKLVEAANNKSAGFVFDYSLDSREHPDRILFRSDHWSFAKKGIPTVFFTDYHHTDYHKPTDDVDKINFLKLKKAVDLTRQTILDAANFDGDFTRDNWEEEPAK